MSRPLVDDERTYLLRCTRCDGWAWSDTNHNCPVSPASRWVWPSILAGCLAAWALIIVAAYRWTRG